MICVSLLALGALAEALCSSDASEPATVVFTAGLSDWTTPGEFIARYRTSAASAAIQIDTTKRIGLSIVIR